MKSPMMEGVHILATGSAVPNLCISNRELSKVMNTSDEWISTRTGIKERRVITETQSIIDLAVDASEAALNKGSFSPDQLDLIILATSSQNDLFGSASQLQASIGATNAAAFDITAACSGFVIGIITASQFIQAGAYKNILVVGADVLSKWVDWSDRSTCILFGDGAGAALLQSSQNNHLLGFQLETNGMEAHQLSIAYKQNPNHLHQNNLFKCKQGYYQYLQMNGREVYKFAVSKVPESIRQCLSRINLSTNDVSWLLLHQANQRILDTVAAKLSIPSCKIISNLEYYGNTSAASIPIALNEANERGDLKIGDIIVIAGFGAGLTWGTVVVRWST
uniref:Beta-ketoacyl-[acyl-carrier-protein] synthase III n=1 Tax=Balbiania investiens TaxID=111861 RepID=A0A4D6BLC1_9FLOR|nr:beta-ketoacyl-acyl carrier protein synthase III [Balbiania investiens]QBX88550.1 beta-ketoacyl-acyl carrier protein synthase III [Balbiania investiens]